MRIEEHEADAEESREPPKLVQPRHHRAKVILWADLTVADMDVLADAITPDQVKKELARIFHLEDNEDNKKTAILLDLYFYTIQFSRDQNFSKEQTSAFFSILKRTHEVCIETPFGNVDQCFCYFKELVLCHAVKRPPYSIDLFNTDQVRLITDYVINTYFRHFKMYKYVFTPLVRLDLSMTYEGMPESPVPSEAGGDTSREGGEEGEGAEQPEGEGAAEGEGEELTPDGEVSERVKSATPEESEAAKELRSLIKQHISDEMKKLKLDIDGQIKETENILNEKLSAVEGTTSGKGSRGSAKGKKK